MDWDALRYVLAVQRAGTLTGAAQALGVARTTVGRRIREVEKSLNVQLFHRSDDGLSPTEAGSDLAATAEQVEAKILASQRRLHGEDTELRGRLRVSTLDFVVAGFSEIFSTFIEKYPDIDLTVTTTTTAVSLIRRETDTALRLSNTPGDHLVGRKIGVMEFEVYAARSLVKRIGKDAAFSAYPWLHFDERSNASWFDSWLASNAPGASITLRTDDYPVIHQAVVAGIGAQFLPCFIGDANPELVRLGARLEQETRDLWLVTLGELRHNGRVRAFMDHAYDALVARRAALAGLLE